MNHEISNVPELSSRTFAFSAGGTVCRFILRIDIGHRHNGQVISGENVENLAKELSRSNPMCFVKLPVLSHTEAGQKIYSGDCWDCEFGLEE